MPFVFPRVDFVEVEYICGGSLWGSLTARRSDRLGYPGSTSILHSFLLFPIDRLGAWDPHFAQTIRQQCTFSRRSLYNEARKPAARTTKKKRNPNKPSQPFGYNVCRSLSETKKPSGCVQPDRHHDSVSHAVKQRQAMLGKSRNTNTQSMPRRPYHHTLIRRNSNTSKERDTTSYKKEGRRVKEKEERVRR